MKVKKCFNIEAVYISSKEQKVNYSEEKYLKCGRQENLEFRLLTKFNISEIKRLYKVENNIKKVELCLYLKDINKESHVNEIMINIGINVNEFNEKTVAYMSQPKFFQQCNMYIVKKEFIGQYIFFDITHIIEFWINGDKQNYGICFLGVTEGGVAIFDSDKSEKRPYIRIAYNKDVLEEYNNETISCKKCESKSYGLFINNSAAFNKNEKHSVVLWNKTINTRGMYLGKDNTKIIIENIGMYQIDYSINMRSNTFTCMAILVNGEEVPLVLCQYLGHKKSNFLCCTSS